jgi:DNA-binding PadR family transcriptional regulator
LEHTIRPAFEDADFGMQVIRADDIRRPGAFIRDILQYIAGAHTVIADLTDQNPNVFYELGVRHALSPRTILIAQRVEDIPSDLRGYRTIIYRTSPDGVSAFQREIQEYLQAIQADPERPDNPVLNELKNVIPCVPDDLRHTFLVRRVNIGRKQQSLLRFIETRAVEPGVSIEQEAISARFKKEFPGAKGSEIYYRLEQLRLLGFIISEQTDNPFLHRYRLSPAYRKEMGLEQ